MVKKSKLNLPLLICFACCREEKGVLDTSWIQSGKVRYWLNCVPHIYTVLINAHSFCVLGLNVKSFTRVLSVLVPLIYFPLE